MLSVLVYPSDFLEFCDFRNFRRFGHAANYVVTAAVDLRMRVGLV